jgi:proline iminopeptidase
MNRMFKYILPLLLCLAAANYSFGQSDKPVVSPTAGRHIITSDGVDLYVTVKGKGTPCLYIHGGPGSGSYWLEKFSGEMLEQHFQMIYLDQRGVSRSTSPKDGNYSMDRMVQDFEEVRKALGIQEWVIMGHSFGGILQMGYAQRYPQVIKGMIMLNCAYNLNEMGSSSWFLKACEILGVTDTRPYTDESIPMMDRIQRIHGELREKDLFWKMSYASKKNKELMDATFDEVPDWNKDYERIALSIKDYWEDFKKLAPDMKMPVLVFYGKTDWMVGPDHYTGINFPNMMLWESDVGHVPFLENKADLEKAITSYLRKYKL